MRIVVAAMLVAASLATAQEFPAKSIRFVVPYAPGGASDVTARLLGQKMTEASIIARAPTASSRSNSSPSRRPTVIRY
jgi:tripartite-type tricarboxylate transporter receptor subunit TctC